ncbi:MAG: GH3 auxin-responsive promoter family protein [Bacteroidota bacterium]
MPPRRRYSRQTEARLLTQSLRRRIALSGRINRFRQDAKVGQERVFQKLLQRSADTAFGRHYGFADIRQASDPREAFRAAVPLCDYAGMHPWWQRAEDGEPNVTWPGKIKYFALSSGTSGAPSKHIPVTKDMIRATQVASVRQLLVLRKFNLGGVALQRRILTLSGSTALQDYGHHFKGDVSGINVKNIPFFMRLLQKPNSKISRNKDWETRLNMMVEKAPKWDIGIVAGVPAWLDVLIERIREEYKVDSIHDIWPHLRAFIHGGVAIDPYKRKLETHFKRPMAYIETYLASEGFIALQTRPYAAGMELLHSNGIYYEFIPFDEEHFDEHGQVLHPHVPTYGIDQVEIGKPYALVMSTCSGAWRYLIGDVVRFVSLAPAELIIDGRTKHFLSLCGEHLSVDNMNQGLGVVAKRLGVSFPEFTVAGIQHGGKLGHHWFVGCDQTVDVPVVQELLDRAIAGVNDDYPVERQHALKHMFVEVLPNRVFLDYLEHLGKVGGQSKFPRVMKGQKYLAWIRWLRENGHSVRELAPPV